MTRDLTIAQEQARFGDDLSSDRFLLITVVHSERMLVFNMSSIWNFLFVYYAVSEYKHKVPKAEGQATTQRKGGETVQEMAAMNICCN